MLILDFPNGDLFRKGADSQMQQLAWPTPLISLVRLGTDIQFALLQQSQGRTGKQKLYDAAHDDLAYAALVHWGNNHCEKGEQNHL